MCIIIAKKAGVKFPNNEILKSCWDGNPDGAGYMFPDNGVVNIKKGFMKYEQLIDSLNSIPNKDDLPMILHFRITTHGGTSKANTHPFPLTSSEKLLRRLRVKSNIGIAHNGIINIDNEKKLSDTMQYIKDELSLFNVIKPSWYKDIKSLEMIKNRIGSKLAIMDSKGYISTVGEFYEDEAILYSNYSYLGYINYGWDTPYSDYSNYDYTWSKEEEELIDRLLDIGLFIYEAEAILWEMELWEIKYILDNDTDSYNNLLNRLYSPSTNNKC